jgi:MFS family permease
VSGLERYRALLRVPHAKALVGWSLLGRVPLGMTPFALLLLVRGEGEGYGAAGVVVAVYSIALGLGAPIRGRRVDRRGPGSVLRYGAVGYAALLGLVVVLAAVDAGTVPIAVVAALAGFVLPPVSATVRVVWPRLAPGDLRTTAYAFEASVQELFFVVGPLLAAALAAIDPLVAVAGAGVACLVGTLQTARLAPVRDTPPSRASSAGVLGALASPGVRTIVLYAALVGLGFGACELAMPAFAEEHGARELGGIALGCFAAGSLVGGFVSGLRPIGNDLRRFIVGAVGVAAGLLALQLAVSLPTLALLSFVAGLPIAPTVAALYTMIDRSARAGTAAEAFAWFGTAISVGYALGAAVAGVVVEERGVRWAFGVGAAIALLGAGVGWLRRGTLAAVHAPGDAVPSLASARSSGDRAADF